MLQDNFSPSQMPQAISGAVIEPVIKVRRKVSPFALLGRFRREKKGTAAVEFAMVALPFFGLLFSVFETAVDFYINSALQTALSDSSRDILTGQAQTAAYTTAQQFINNSLCGLGTIKRRLPDFIQCSKIQIDVRPAVSFTGNDMSKPVIGGVLNTSTWGYNAGATGQIVIVRAIYTVPVITSIFGAPNSIVSTGSSWRQRVLMATAAFQNEPF